jgi:hypothetical protein
VGAVSHRRTVVAARTFYAAALEEGAQLRYAIRMLRLYALAFGFLFSAAAREPAAHRHIVLAAAPRRNRAHAYRLLLVPALLIWWLPR